MLMGVTKDSRFRLSPYFFAHNIRHSQINCVPLHRKFDEMTRREINIVKREQKMAETFGRYNIFATLSLSLSLSLSGTNSQSQKSRASAREYTAFLG